MAKDELVSMSMDMVDPYYVTGKDFPFKGGMAAGMASGADTLVPMSETQEGPGRNADDSISEYRCPSEWGKEGRAFTVGTNKGESSSSASTPAMKWGVDMVGGQSSPNVSTDRD